MAEVNDDNFDEAENEYTISLLKYISEECGVDSEYGDKEPYKIGGRAFAIACAMNYVSASVLATILASSNFSRKRALIETRDMTERYRSTAMDEYMDIRAYNASVNAMKKLVESVGCII